ncbi:hypothetical protein A3E49_03115 [Candidatus Saccharibacteria bacterium RIFCSPHIGHO2_12_FULL_49_19]|nr:MAG: hypothetical protein A2708_02695 [Candidatus Saccharibacteria bacterium RIFCSPHIGHO2_01_FULL_49_21]OGL37064.1 MAG: hypothetical protein A3E49_03115 [Candidatus Saccharibacteria bacterium RIFCSPHIGHO2_12_FULL_49_19]OGL37696.1 MAG: hypothetical protein A3B63_00520 [Candidatus Saccharibacteria bacterium RIFCSPLOWO2_01_FULL_49_22]
MDFGLLFGYLDAGTGSIIVQSIVGITAGVAVFGRRILYGFWQKIKSLFSRSEPRSQADKP